MSQSCSKCIAYLALNQLDKNLRGEQLLTLAQLMQNDPSARTLPDSAPLFVSWHKKGALRGCIGTFSPQPLEDGVRRFAEVAAFDDGRFKPIGPSELPLIDVTVTILSPLERIHDLDDWVLGKHGLEAVFPGGKTATYLPEVPVEQGWSKERTLEMLADKAGASSTSGICLWRYEGQVSKATYAEYAERFLKN